jgi:diguanylate cyclase (GGDEF)-like protein
MERGQAIALFECTLPSEVIAGLGSSAEPVRVRLIWKPSLLATTDFQISAALVVLGLLGIMFSGHRSQASEKPIESVDHSSSKHNEPHLTPGAAASVISAQGKDASKGSSAEVVDIRSRKPLELHQGTLEHTDALTGLANRSHFLSIAEVEVQKASQSGGALAVLLLSIDQLRQINTVHGRKAGDAVLKELAGLCRGSRERDVSARWTGEEFVLLLPETDHAGARVVADRLSWGAEQLQFRDIPHLQAAISIGVAELLPGEASVLPALLRASQARDAAENGRRNGTTDTWDT